MKQIKLAVLLLACVSFLAHSMYIDTWKVFYQKDTQEFIAEHITQTSCSFLGIRSQVMRAVKNKHSSATTIFFKPLGVDKGTNRVLKQGTSGYRVYAPFIVPAIEVFEIYQSPHYSLKDKKALITDVSESICEDLQLKQLIGKIAKKVAEKENDFSKYKVRFLLEDSFELEVRS
jgi:guanylate kinase